MRIEGEVPDPFLGKQGSNITYRLNSQIISRLRGIGMKRWVDKVVNRKTKMKTRKKEREAKREGKKKTLKH